MAAPTGMFGGPGADILMSIPEGKNAMTSLVCDSVVFYSLNDEEAFFQWLEKIPSVQSVSEQNQEIIIQTKTSELPDEDLRDIIAIFFSP